MGAFANARQVSILRLVYRQLEQFLFVTFLLIGCSAVTFGQACGYTFLTIFLKDGNGNLVKNADIQLFNSDFSQKDTLHFPLDSDDGSSEPLRRRLEWSEKRQAFFGSEGMCSGHKNVGLRIIADGFEKFDHLINLPLGRTVYEFQLRRHRSDGYVQVKQLSNFRGSLKDKLDALITEANVKVSKAGKDVFETSSDDNGQFEFNLAEGEYKFTIYKPGFRRLIITNVVVTKPLMEYLDLKLKVRGCDDCKGDLYGENDGTERADEVIDYRTIIEK